MSTSVTFYFDPVCPWAYQTSLWIREARRVRSLDIDWRFLSLQAINQGTENLKEAHALSMPSFRIMAEARRLYGPESVDRLYESIGHARHEKKQDISNSHNLEEAVRHAGLDPSLVARGLANDSTMDDVQSDHTSGVVNGAFGVPSIEIDGDNRPFFGPVISEVPTGEPAGELWDHFAWLIGQAQFYEIKRERH